MQPISSIFVSYFFFLIYILNPLFQLRTAIDIQAEVAQPEIDILAQCSSNEQHIVYNEVHIEDLLGLSKLLSTTLNQSPGLTEAIFKVSTEVIHYKTFPNLLMN